MSVADLIIIIMLVVAVGYACYSIWKARKNGRSCPGCSNSGTGLCGESCKSSSKSKTNK